MSALPQKLARGRSIFEKSSQPGIAQADTPGMSTPLLFLIALRFDDRLLAELAWLIESGDFELRARA